MPACTTFCLAKSRARHTKGSRPQCAGPSSRSCATPRRTCRIIGRTTKMWRAMKGVEISAHNGTIRAQMVRTFSLIALLFGSILSIRPALAADNEADLYSQAAKAFEDKFYERAEQQFAEFVAKFP